MVLNSVYISISSLNSGFSIADFLCRGVQFAMQSKFEQPCHLPWHGFKQNVLGWHPSVHSSTWLYDRSSVQPSNSRPRIPKKEVDSLCKMSFHVRSDRFHRHSAEVRLQCHLQRLRRPARRSPTQWGFFAGNAAIIGYGRSETFKLHIFWKCEMKRTTVMKQGSNNSSKRSRSC